MQCKTAGECRAGKAVLLGIVLFCGFLVLNVVAGRFSRAHGMLAPAERSVLSGFVMSDLTGNTWDLDEHHGKAVVINFWATWCPPCQQETPDLVSVANQYRDKGVDTVGVSLDQGGGQTVRDFAAKYHVPYPVLLPKADSPLVGQISTIPVTVLVDRRGRIARVYDGMISRTDLTQDLDHLLAEADQRLPVSSHL